MNIKSIFTWKNILIVVVSMLVGFLIHNAVGQVSVSLNGMESAACGGNNPCTTPRPPGGVTVGGQVGQQTTVCYTILGVTICRTVVQVTIQG